MTALTPEQDAEVRAIVAEMIGQALRDVSTGLNRLQGDRLRCLELAVALAPADPIRVAKAMTAFVEGTQEVSRNG